MKYKGREQSQNVEDYRGGGTGRKVGTSLGCGTIVILLIAFLLGANPASILEGMGPTTQAPSQTTQSGQSSDELGEFVKVVLKDTEDVWNTLFPSQLGKRYREPKMVLFEGGIRSGCGMASARSGPFYCPADEKLYIDLDFYRELSQKFDAPGDFAMAYVIAHEVGHHVQKLLGITQQVQSQRGRIRQAEYNELSVKLELQADFLAGVWAHHAQRTKGILERGDLEEAMRAAHQIGDDAIQRRTQGFEVPHTFTHGTSAQRMRWFRKGLESGDLREGDTFRTSLL